MGKGKKKSFGDSPADMLLKRKLGTAKYEQMKKEFKPQIPKRPVENLVYPADSIIKARQSGWGKGLVTELSPGGVPGGMWTISTDGSYAWAGEPVVKEPEKTPEEERDDWADRWVAEQT